MAFVFMFNQPLPEIGKSVYYEGVSCSDRTASLQVPAQQSVQWTGGESTNFRAFSRPEQNPALKVLSTPVHLPLTQTVSAPSEAWRFLQGERPCRTRSNQPIVPSVAVMKEAAKAGLRSDRRVEKTSALKQGCQRLQRA